MRCGAAALAALLPVEQERPRRLRIIPSRRRPAAAPRTPLTDACCVCHRIELANRLTVGLPSAVSRIEPDEEHPYPPDDINCVELHADSLDALELFPGDVVLVKGRMGLRAYCRVFQTCALPGTILMNEVLRKNLAVRHNDRVVVRPISDEEVVAAKLERIVLRPLAESVEGLVGDLATTFLVPYFSEDPEAGGMQGGRPVREGQVLRMPGAMRLGWFLVDKLEPASSDQPGQSWGVVRKAQILGPDGVSMVPGTEVLIDEEISSERMWEDLNKEGYGDVGGLDEQLDQIRNIIELPLRHPKLFDVIGIKPPKGVLMHGPPGCGKTLIARAIAHEVGCFFYPINGPEIIGGQFGQSERNLQKAFAECEKYAPAILFIDEIDSIAPNRDKIQDEHLRRVVATLLTLMDGIKKKAKVMVIGATNRPNAIDPALRRAGRFDSEVVIPVPSEKARREILEKMIIGKGTKITKMNPDFPPDAPENANVVDLDKLASMTQGFVGADLSSMCTKAAVSYVRNSIRDVLDRDPEELPAGFMDGLSVGMDAFEAAVRDTTASALRDVAVAKTNVTFDDIGGLETTKRELREMIQMPIEHPELFEAAGIMPPKGALLYGPPGCGKTMLAKAVANECKANFISIKGPQLLSKWFGESEENVRDLFDKARRASPCVIFFDEIDSICIKRGLGHGGTGAGDRVVNQLLTEMDGIASRKQVFIIGATNNIRTLDPAVMRPGRLDQFIYVPMPDDKATHSVLLAQLAHCKAGVKDVTLERLSEDCLAMGFSGADIANMVKFAVKISLRQRLAAKARGEDVTTWPLTHDVFERAMKASKPSLTRDTVAIYEAERAKIMEEMGVVGEVTQAIATEGKFRLPAGDPRLDGPGEYGRDAYIAQRRAEGLDSDSDDEFLEKMAHAKMERQRSGDGGVAPGPAVTGGAGGLEGAAGAS